ncbi:DMBT1-like protein [Mya arenaria]|uniref:DMBT1-like protein n=1 Tax=Mya arenaria TaxID=6604 RepID=A0ABY7FL48_MYAAR|nr:DMBT1-like protein [Mya arenaria]
MRCRIRKSQFSKTFSLLKYFTGSKHGPGNGPVMFDHMGCSSYHNHIKDCSYYTPLKYCYSTDTVSLLCSECGPVNEHGTASYSENGTLATITCSYDYYTKDPVVECINGSWSKLGMCDFHGPPLNITSVRLVDGVNEYEGRVEIEVNGTYGTICDSLFDLNDAETICRTINSRYCMFTLYITTVVQLKTRKRLAISLI